MKKLLVVVDMQNDFVSGSLGFPEAKSIIPKIREKIDSYLNVGNDVVFTRDTHFESIYLTTREGQHLPVPHCYDGTKGWQIVDELREDDLVHIDKIAFGLDADDISLISGYKSLDSKYESIEIVGLVTNLCVLSVAISLQSCTKFCKIIIDAACCKSFDPVLHEKALDVMEGLQMNVINR